MQLRERKKKILRDTLVRNAVNLFREHGYEAISLDEIAAASMCSRSTLHRYFGTKEDLLFPTAGERLRTMKAQLRSALSNEDPWIATRRVVSAALSGFLEDLEPSLRMSCIRLWFSEPAPHRRYLEIVMQWENVLSEFLEPYLVSSKSRTLELYLLTYSISSALRAALNAGMKTGAEVRGLIDPAFDLIESGVSANLLRLRQRTSAGRR